MEIELLDVITLDNNKEYIVGSIAKKDNKTYYCLLNKEKNDDILICERKEKATLREVNNSELIKSLLPEFYKSIKESHLLDEFLKNLPEFEENA